MNVLEPDRFIALGFTNVEGSAVEGDAGIDKFVPLSLAEHPILLALN